jgi:uncharacterized protein (DUF697 family)
MNRKKLPKVIRRVSNPIGNALAESGGVAPQGTFVHAADFERAAPVGTVAFQPSSPARSVEAPRSQSPSTPDVRPLPTRKNGDARTSQQRSQANRIVERHAVYAGLGGIIPVPLANVASITAVIVRMVKVLSRLYGVPFERDRARAIIIGLMGGAMPTGLAAATTSTLVYVVPASGIIGLAVSSLTGAACTRSIGRIFVEHFESGATLHDLSATSERQSRLNGR